jgi:hypothetical protein
MIDTVLGKILSVIKGGTGKQAYDYLKPSEKYKSIARQSDKAICQFPVIASKAMTYDTATMIVKACERNFTTFMGVVIGLNQVIDSNTGAVDYISRFHTNTDDTIERVSGYIDTKVNESVSPIDKKEMQRLLLEANVEFGSQFEAQSLNDRYKPVDIKSILATESVASGEVVVGMSDEEKSNAALSNKMVEPPFKSILKDSDVKKANELVPSLMSVQLVQRNDAGQNIPIHFLLGIKAVLHPVGSVEMINNVFKAFDKGSRGKFFDFLRWTTGEISFIKDLVLGLDEVKRDISAERNKKESPWWNILRNRNSMGRFRKWTKTAPLLPNATIAMTQAEVDNLRANTGVDILDPGSAVQVMQQLGLLQFIVVDDANDVAYFLIDGQTKFQTYTFNALQRDNGDAEKQAMRLIKQMNKL